MDADNTADRRPAPQGGIVEPARRPAGATERAQAPEDPKGERYELRDPFGEVTYRASSFGEMAARADALGSSRFVALADDGRRTTIERIDGEWRRGAQRPAWPERPLDRPPARDEVPELPQTAAKGSTQPEQKDDKAGTKADGKADREAFVARLEAALMERYVIKRAPVTVGDLTVGRTEYRFRGDTSRVAFTETTFRLATDTNSPSVARSMVDVAEARNWKALRVSGNEDFRRMVWLEASVRGVKIQGYDPTPAELELLQREREARLVNRIEPARDTGGTAASATAEKPSSRGSGGRKPVLAAIEAVLVAKKVPETQRLAVMAAANEKLAARVRSGLAPKVKIYDKSAPSQRTTAVPVPEQQRSRERAEPARTR
jgi:hypothetical protein